MKRAVSLSLKIAWQVDKRRVFYGLFYNLIKQFFNVFYGVYFLRTILVCLETGRDFLPIFLLLCFMLAVNIIFYLMNAFFQEKYLPQFDIKINQYLYDKIVERASEQPYDAYCQPEFLDRYKRALDFTAANVNKVLNSLGTMCGLIAALAMVAVYVVQVDVFAILLSALPLIYSYSIGKKSEAYKFELNQNNARSDRKKNYARRVFYLPQYAKELKLTAVSKVVQAIYDEGTEEKIGQYKTIGKKAAIFQAIGSCVSDGVIIMLPIAYVAIRVLLGSTLMIGDFIGIAQSITYFAWDLEWFFSMVIDIKAASLYLLEYQNYLKKDNKDNKENAGMPGQGTDIGEAPFSLVCKDLFYVYPGKPDEDPALRHINLTIRQGEKIAIVGENGAGKTTLVYLLMHLLSSTKGEIELNGKNLNDIAPEQLKRFFGTVFQDFHLYPLSVRENICINGPQDDEAVWSAIQKVGLSDCISDLSLPLTREFSDDGLELSGGQQQRLVLARVIANDYPFILLDEPTSALDPITEREIYQLIFHAAADKTLVFISHRLATTRFVDRILVLKDGRIVEEGSHEKLMAAKGYYHDLYALQEAMYREKKI